MSRPTHERLSQRKLLPLRCEIEIAGKLHSAVIRDLTAQGIFVATHIAAKPGAAVRLRVPWQGEIWQIEAKVVRAADRGRSLVSGRGLALTIQAAPSSFHEFVASLDS